MKSHQRTRVTNVSIRRKIRLGITLMEVTVSTFLVSLIVIGALRCLAASTRLASATTQKTLGTLLAEELMEEILTQDYEDPDETVVFGTESSETSSVRTLWDDVDDYDQWSASPPEDIDGNAIADDTWTRSVVVEQVDEADLEDVRPDSEDTGVKRITVSVQKNGNVVAELKSIQTTGWISMIPEASAATTTGQLPPANQAPTATIASHTTSGTETVNVDFDGDNSTDPEDAPLEFLWDFGDGQTSEESQPSHTFSNSSNETVAFSVQLRVKDIHGAEDTATTTVTVFPGAGTEVKIPREQVSGEEYLIQKQKGRYAFRFIRQSPWEPVHRRGVRRGDHFCFGTVGCAGRAYSPENSRDGF